MDTLSGAIQELREIGFTADFKLGKKGLSKDGSDQWFPAEEVIIRRKKRFEGKSNPSDMSIVYGLETPDGTKGVLIDGYGVYFKPEHIEFLVKLEKHNK